MQLRNLCNPEISNWEDVLAQAEIIEISENVAHKQDNQTGTTSLWRDGVFRPYFPVPQINPSNVNLRSSRSMTFDSKQHKQDSRPPPSVNQASMLSRSGQSQRSWSFWPTSIPGRVGYADKVARATGLTSKIWTPELSSSYASSFVWKGKNWVSREVLPLQRTRAHGTKLPSG